VNHRRCAALVALLLLPTAACTRGSAPNDASPAAPGSPGPTSTTLAVDPVTQPSTSVATTTTTLPAMPTSTSTSTSTTSTSTTSTTTTTTTIPLDVYDPACVVRVLPGDSLDLIADRFDDETIDGLTLIAENGLPDDVIGPDQLIDVCVDNGVNDISGEARTERNAEIVRREVVVQQTKLNELFAGYGIRELLVDGISGPVTRQRLCAFRLAVGLPVSTDDMIAGSPEEQQLMATAALPIPYTSAILSERWVLIDQTCQIMFIGEGTTTLRFVFPTSTGLPEFPTRAQNRSRVFKYNPELDNGGWHDSLTYPAAEDNPLNGNMYKPLYFDRGQAIHGANNVPTSPQSHGCARLRVEHQDLLVSWLGLTDVGGIVGTNRINLTVNVQGAYIAK
jgi:hypothetical protein